MNTVQAKVNVILRKLLDKYKQIQLPGISKMPGRGISAKGTSAKLKLKENVRSIVLKSRPVPFKLISLVEEELKRLEAEGILEKVDASDWATPIVPVLKKNKQVRIFRDFSITLNPQLVVDEHSLSTSDYLCCSMANGVPV